MIQIALNCSKFKENEVTFASRHDSINLDLRK